MTPRWRPRTWAPVITRWRRPSRAGAIRRPTAETCCWRARPGWASRQLTRRTPNTKYSGPSSWRRPTHGDRDLGLAPDQLHMIVGIDLGTTNSLVGTWRDGAPMLIP